LTPSVPDPAVTERGNRLSELLQQHGEIEDLKKTSLSADHSSSW
jgi:hypothetical protein